MPPIVSLIRPCAPPISPGEPEVVTPWLNIPSLGPVPVGVKPGKLPDLKASPPGPLKAPIDDPPENPPSVPPNEPCAGAPVNAAVAAFAAVCKGGTKNAGGSVFVVLVTFFGPLDITKSFS